MGADDRGELNLWHGHPDGLTLGVVIPAMYIEQVTGKKKVQYDRFKFSFIGSPEKTDRIFYMSADTSMLRR